LTVKPTLYLEQEGGRRVAITRAIRDGMLASVCFTVFVRTQPILICLCYWKRMGCVVADSSMFRGGILTEVMHCRSPDFYLSVLHLNWKAC